MNCKLYSQGTFIIMMVTIQTCDNYEILLESRTISSKLVVIFTMFINAQVFYGEDGQVVMVKIQTWTGGKSIRVQHTSTSIFTLIFNMHHVIISISFGVTFCFIGMEKHQCQYFYLHQHQVEVSLIPFPVFTATNHCQGRVNLAFIQIIIFLSHNFCVSRKLDLCKYLFFYKTISH